MSTKHHGSPTWGGRGEAGKAATLKDVAEQLDLSITTVSLVLNHSPAASSIPAHTQERVFAAAKRLRYQPNVLARSLRSRRTRSIGVLVQEMVEGYTVGVMNGIQSHLFEEGYFFLVASHQGRSELRDRYLRLLRDRRVEGFILVNTPVPVSPELATVTVSGHDELEGVTNVVLDHDRAAHLALSHLAELGHERIALFKGPEGSADAEDRWRSILTAAERLGLECRSSLMLQLDRDPARGGFSAEAGYREGYLLGRQLLDSGADFTALFAFNDLSAMGAMRAFLDADLRIPEDFSVVGFDDIESAAFHNPALTTIRQPLKEMGKMASSILLQRLSGDDSFPHFVSVEPELVMRGSTGPAPSRGGEGRSAAAADRVVHDKTSRPG